MLMLMLMVMVMLVMMFMLLMLRLMVVMAVVQNMVESKGRRLVQRVGEGNGDGGGGGVVVVWDVLLSRRCNQVAAVCHGSHIMAREAVRYWHRCLHFFSFLTVLSMLEDVKEAGHAPLDGRSRLAGCNEEAIAADGRVYAPKLTLKRHTLVRYYTILRGTRVLLSFYCSVFFFFFFLLLSSPVPLREGQTVKFETEPLAWTMRIPRQKRQ